MKRVPEWTLEKVTEHSRNIYEAVIIAAKKSRMLNEERLVRLELMPEDDSIVIDTRKVTEVALKELSEGKIEVKR